MVHTFKVKHILFTPGMILADVLREYCDSLGIDDGLSALGFAHTDIQSLAYATIPQQQRATKLSPRQNARDDIAHILERAMKLY